MVPRLCCHRLPRRRVFWLLPVSAALAWIVSAAFVSADPPATATATAAAEAPPLVITADTTLDPAKTYPRIVIQASGVTINGRGATVLGATSGKPKDYKGIGIAAKGVSHVTLRNLRAKGWDIGLKIEDGNHWLVENCDFSDNFHDPEQDWGELGRRGGIILDRVDHSTFRKNKANHVWDACLLADSNDNLLEDNDFSHTSNTCVSLWTACRNKFKRNVLSWGLRIKPGETHARDSACVLIESGSNDNLFSHNDITHGGDGVFLRPLNAWVSTGNVFEYNDASYAHNNCFESQAPRNVYRHNKANYGSYGFWLGMSDQSVLVDNEASYNGTQPDSRNAPELPDGGFAGIILLAPASHIVVRGNTCVGNNGAGIVLRGNLDPGATKIRHWIIEQNTVKDNRWGIYMQNADWIDMAANLLADNKQGDVKNCGQITNLFEHADNPAITRPPKAGLRGPATGLVGEPVVFDASHSSDPGGNPLRFRWDLGDGTVAEKPRMAHVFKAPGFYRVGMTVSNGLLSDLAWRDFYAVEKLAEMGTEGQAADWSWIDPGSKVKFTDDPSVRISGRSSVHAYVRPYSGGRVALLYPASRKAQWSLADKTSLVFWVKAIDENVPAWQDNNPVVIFYESEKRSMVLTPTVDLMGGRPNNEEREGWTYFVVPLAGSKLWKRTGERLTTANYLTISFDSWGNDPFQIWIDGMAFK